MDTNSGGQRKTGRSLIATVAGLAVTVAAVFFGVDIAQQEGNGGTSAASSEKASEKPSSPSSSAPKPGPKTSAAKTTTAKAPAPEQAGAVNEKAAKKGIKACPVATLPEQASIVVDLIKKDGPFEHPDNDGVHFGNYEDILPIEKRSYYREYTVDTPGVSHRGERRIITGGGSDTDPDVWYYTADHYGSFCEITDAE